LGVGQPVPEREMIPVPFPLDKGLLGYRVALIDRHSQDRLSHINSIEDLRRMRCFISLCRPKLSASFRPSKSTAIEDVILVLPRITTTGSL
jgi:hypothetical protein